MVQAASKKQCDDDQTFHTHYTLIHHFWLTISHMQHLSSHHILSLIWYGDHVSCVSLWCTLLWSFQQQSPAPWDGFSKHLDLYFFWGAVMKKMAKSRECFSPERYLWVWECRRGLKEEAGLELTGIVTNTKIFCSATFWLLPTWVLNASIWMFLIFEQEMKPLEWPLDTQTWI